MAPVPLEPSISYKAVATVASHLAASVWLTVLVVRRLKRANSSIAPAQDTRLRSARRSKIVPIFTSLAAVSLVWTIWGALRYATLSYKVWASNRGVDVPARFYGAKGILSPDDRAPKLHLAQWLSETPLYWDAAEILTEKARRFWWAQQIDLSRISWTMLLAIEGRRRNIPLLWCYQLLGQLVSLSYAQNLFFVALLLTPSPLPQFDGDSSRFSHVWNRVFKPKPSKWTPHPAAYLLILVLNLCAIGAAPLFVNTPTFGSIFVASRILSFAPVALPYILPFSWGTVHTELHEAYGGYAGIFRTIFLFSLALHGKATVVGLAYNAPESQVHRHSIHLPFDIEKRSAWERTTSAFGRILTATSDHPVVARMGWDVLFSGLSLGLWAAARVTDVLHVVTYPALHRSHGTVGEDIEEVGKQVATTKSTSGTAKAALRSALESEGNHSHRRRGRSRTAKAATEPEDLAGDSTYEPTPAEAAEAAEGDVLPSAGEEGWESAALAWGLGILGGLGAGSAAVFGGECLAR